MVRFVRLDPLSARIVISKRIQELAARARKRAREPQTVETVESRQLLKALGTSVRADGRRVEPQGSNVIEHRTVTSDLLPGNLHALTVGQH